MLYLFYGEDTSNKNKHFEKFVSGLPKDAEVFSVSRNDFDPMQIESFYSGAGLFSSLHVVIFKNILDHAETREFILSKTPLMAESSNHFIFLEGKLNKPIVEVFKKAKGEVNIFELPKEKKEKYDNFLVANAFANRDKLNTWIHFRRAIDLGVAMEEITGVIFWKIKDSILKKNFSKFSETELKNFASKISYLLPEARREGKDAEAAFEEFLLEAF